MQYISHKEGGETRKSEDMDCFFPVPMLPRCLGQLSQGSANLATVTVAKNIGGSSRLGGGGEDGFTAVSCSYYSSHVSALTWAGETLQRGLPIILCFLARKPLQVQKKEILPLALHAQGRKKHILKQET